MKVLLLRYVPKMERPQTQPGGERLYHPVHSTEALRLRK